MAMKLPVFVSTPKSYLQVQKEFVSSLETSLLARGLEPVTLGRSEYDINAPLEAVRRLMNACCGLICIGLRRTYVAEGVDRPASDIGEVEKNRAGTWLSSAYCQIEPAMAYQIGLPILLWREKGVADDGVFDRGAVGLSMPEFDLSNPPALTDQYWSQPLDQWVDMVRSVHRNRGNAPKLW
jgi:hypothetical protein